jgi:hypothetical protein
MTVSTRRMGHQMRLSPIERAVARAAWKRDVVDTQLHALLGEDQDLIRQKVGAMIFAIGTAARLASWSPDTHDFCLMHTALLGLAEMEDIGLTPRIRWAITDGIEALGRIEPLVDMNLIILATAKLRELCKGDEDITVADFESIFKTQAP